MKSPLQKIIEEQEKKFDDEFPPIQCVTPAYAFWTDSVTAKSDKLKSFNRSSLIEAFRAVREEVERMKKPHSEHCYCRLNLNADADICGCGASVENQVLSKVLALLAPITDK